MVRFAGVALALGAGCGHTMVLGEDTCADLVFEDVADDDASLGFTAADVLAALPAPSGVSWELTRDDVAFTDTLALTGPALAGTVRIVDLDSDPSCMLGATNGGSHLVVPVTLGVSIGGGEVDATGVVELWAAAADPALVKVHAGWDLPVEPTGAYGDAIDAWWAAEQASHPEATGWIYHGAWVVPFGTWSELSLDIETRHDSSEVSSASALWRGPAVFDPPIGAGATAP